MSEILCQFMLSIAERQFLYLTLRTDQHLISPYNITLESNIKVMRIKEMVINLNVRSS